MIKKTILSSIIIFSALSSKVECGIWDSRYNETGLQNYLLAQGLDSQMLENYLVLTEKPIKKITSSDESVVRAKILTTVMNERNTIVIKALSLGNAVLTAETEDGNFNINVAVKKNGTFLKTDASGFDFVPLDFPPEVMKIDEPPEVGGP